MPGIAHAVVNNALNLGFTTLEWTKSKDGTYLKWAVEKVEGPAKSTLETRLCKTVLKVGDSCLTLADNTIESALNTSTYKTCEALVKTTYSNKLKPAVTNTAGVVATTTNRVTTPVAKVYVRTLEIANRQVDYFLPGDVNEAKSNLSIIGLATKVTGRTGRRIYFAKEWTVTKVKNVSNGVVYTVKQAHPVNVKNNVYSLCWMVLVRADNIVDSFLPDADDHSPQPKGPISLGSKIVRRSAKRTAAGIRAAATAVRTSPATFKAAARSALSTAKALPRRVADSASAAIAYDYRGAASSRALSVVTAADSALQRYRLTAPIRDLVVVRFGGLVRRLLNLRSPVTPAPPLPAQLPAPAPAEEEPATAGHADAKEGGHPAPPAESAVPPPPQSAPPPPSAAAEDSRSGAAASGIPRAGRAGRARAGEPHGARVPSE